MVKARLRMVIDTNLLVAAMFRRTSASARILERAEAGKVRIMWDGAVRREAELITGRIAKAVPHAEVDLDSVFKPSNRVRGVRPVEGAVREDPDDDKFLACAAAAGADAIVSNDRHLLDLESWQGIPVLTPARALARIQKAA